ncbi:formyltransferase family protein [Dactylosporangium sp. NPDC051484]|uniref:methionyl-tRNA formyltransferase n=1 Tax=Dactylosporangium sp. NPDC051484 TaxID=3154942 RepID=UPI00344C1895
MPEPMRVVLAASGAEQFNMLRDTCLAAGHEPVAYVVSRSMRPRSPVDAWMAGSLSKIVAQLPDGIDLLVPASGAGLARQLVGYRPDLVVVHGFNWRLPVQVLEMATHGAINIHPSLLPKYRGPAPVLAAIRAGDQSIGLTVHRMDEGFDTGPILVQRGGIVLDEWVTPELLWSRMGHVLAEALAESLKMVAGGALGRPQGDAGASYAGFIEPEFSVIDWGRTAAQVHDQVRMFAYLGRAPVGVVDGVRLRVVRTSLAEADGLRVECADAPIWIVESAPEADQPFGA